MTAKFTIGCDPELFVKKNGRPVSAFGLVQGTKESPQKTKFGAVQVDGMALEINTNPVDLYNFEQFNANIVGVMSELKALVPGYSLAIQPVMDFKPEYLAEQPKEALELGCDPDYNAYTMQENPRPDGERPFRSGAGHIHIGWGANIPTDNEEHREICAEFVKRMDMTVGLLMTVMDEEPRRRELYGKAGAFRPKPYGVEYRTPSNVWLQSRTTRQLVHSATGRAVQYMQSQTSFEHLTSMEGEIVQIINEGNVAKAIEIIERSRLFGYKGSFDSRQFSVMLDKKKRDAAKRAAKEQQALAA